MSWEYVMKRAYYAYTGAACREPIVPFERLSETELAGWRAVVDFFNDMGDIPEEL